MMKDRYLLADIGNTSIDVAVFQKELEDVSKFTSEEEEKLENYLSLHKNLKGVLISSVNHKNLDLLLSHLKKEAIPFHVITPSDMEKYALKHGYTIRNTAYLGCDLFCDVIAMETRENITIDLGTVGKILYLDRQKVFYGASIFPDISQFPKMMDFSTDLLKGLSLKDNPPVVSLKTEECISSGAVYGILGTIHEVVSKIKEIYSPENPKVYLTGGNASRIKDLLLKEDPSIEYVPNLPLKGVARILSDFDNHFDE